MITRSEEEPMAKGVTTFARAAAAAVAFVLLPGAGIAAEFELRLAHVTSAQEPIQQAMERFAANVAERTDGRVEITIYPGGILGTNPEVYEQVRAGAPIITISDPGFLSDFVPDFGILGGPYLMKDPRDFTKIIESDLYADLKGRLRAEAGLELLALNWFFGSRNMISDRSIKAPEDVAGMTFRTPPNIMWVETFNAMGARPVQLAWAEVYGGLSAGVVDGAEAPLPSIYGAKLHEVKKTISLTGHFKGFTGLIINADYFAGLPADIQRILAEEAVTAGVFMTDLMLNSEQEWIAKLEAKGVAFIRDVNIDAFQEITAPVYQKFPAWSEGLYDRVRSILDN